MFRLITILFAAISLVSGRRIQNFEGRIVGGLPVNIREYPYQVSVQVLGEHWCGGSLLKSDSVLTAAHCVTRWTVPQLSVRAGSSIVNVGGDVIAVEEVFVHPEYNLTARANYDVSVVKLQKPFDLGPYIQTISLQPVNVEVPVGSLGTVTGWGTLNWEGESTQILQAVQVPKVSYNDCIKSYSARKVTDSMTCYGFVQGGKDSCQGDSGGPLVVDKFQVGVVSWGAACASPNKPGVYARLENKKIADFINYYL